MTGYSSSVYGWIAGCIRNGGAPKAPTDGICGCSGGSAKLEYTAWYCQSPSDMFQLGAAEVGLVTHSLCMHVGVSNSPQAFWRPRSSMSSTGAATCCFN